MAGVLREGSRRGGGSSTRAILYPAIYTTLYTHPVPTLATPLSAAPLTALRLHDTAAPRAVTEINNALGSRERRLFVRE